LEKVYTGKVIEVNGIAVKPVNATTGSSVRNRFLQVYLNEDEDQYTAYWTVRRYIGKGASPRELTSSADVINFVKSTPGAIGYIDEVDVQPGVNVLLK
jgi:ABC-type phosphate transport system substrate-binding protein